jgi:hypothetical protein
VNGNPAPQIGQTKGGPSIATVDGAEQRKERVVLRDRQQLPIAKGPTPWGKVAREHPDFTYKWF